MRYEGNYTKLRGLRDALSIETTYLEVSKDFGDDYFQVLQNLLDECDNDFAGFDLPQHAWYLNEDPRFQVRKSSLSVPRQRLSCP